MKPCDRAVMDQTQAFIRDEADKDEVTEMLSDQRFVAGATFALTMALHRMDSTAPFHASLAVVDLVDAWQAMVRERFGL